MVVFCLAEGGVRGGFGAVFTPAGAGSSRLGVSVLRAVCRGLVWETAGEPVCPLCMVGMVGAGVAVHCVGLTLVRGLDPGATGHWVPRR